MGGTPRMSDELNTGATSETTQTWKTIQTKHTLSHSNKANMKAWLWRPSDIRRPYGHKASWHLSYRWGNPEKTSPRKLATTGDRTRTRCVTGAHATACSTAVDHIFVNIIYLNLLTCLYRFIICLYMTFAFLSSYIESLSSTCSL